MPGSSGTGGPTPGPATSAMGVVARHDDLDGKPVLAFRDVATFKSHLRDFLVQSKQFADADNRALYEEEVEKQKDLEREQLARIAGILNPYEVQDAQDDMDKEGDGGL